MEKNTGIVILERARSSSHGLYRDLDFDKGVKFVGVQLGLDVVRWVTRARGGLGELNTVPWRQSERRMCTCFVQ